MSEAFEQRAAGAYEAQDLDRDEDFARGLLLDECFVLDPEAARAVGKAAGGGGPAFRIADTNHLSGVPGEDETLNCSLGSSGVRIAVVAGTTPVDAEGRRVRIAQGSKTLEAFEGSPPGLDVADVAAVRGEGVARLEWLSDGFVVGVTGREDQLGGEAGFAALSAAVEGVARTLGA